MPLRWAMMTVLLAGAAGAAGAEEAPRRWAVAVEPAWGRLHGDAAPAGSLRVFRALDGGGRIRAQAGLTASSHGAFDVGIEARPCRACRVAPVLGVGGGLMAEDEYAGAFLRATAGLEAELSPRLTLRATVQAGTHDGQAGPHLLAIGLGWRF